MKPSGTAVLSKGSTKTMKPNFPRDPTSNSLEKRNCDFTENPQFSNNRASNLKLHSRVSEETFPI